MNTSIGIAVIIPTWGRPEALENTLRRVLGCMPPPVEILVHVDAGDPGTLEMLGEKFSGMRVRWLSSEITRGPGGGRNRLIEASSVPFLVSLDDDSWAIDSDFFATAEALLNAHPKAGLVAANVFARGQHEPERGDSFILVSGFENCGCVFRRDAFLSTAGYLPLRHAYGMEETDLSLQLLDGGWEIYRTNALRIFHDTELKHHATAPINAAQIANTGLLAFLRYPARHWLLGVGQVINRAYYSFRMRRFHGLIKGLLLIPKLCWDHRRRRSTVDPATIRLSRSLRGNWGKNASLCDLDSVSDTDLSKYLPNHRKPL